MDVKKLELKLEVRPTILRRSPRELLIFSLDDTLIDTSLYWLARSALARAITEKTGSTEGETPGVYDTWTGDENRVYESGTGRDQVTTHDIWQAFRAECEMPQEENSDLYLTVALVLRSKYPTAIPGAETLLKWAQTRFTLAMLTTGDRDLQLQKIEGAKLGGFFKAVKAVPAKRTEDYLALIAEMGFSPRNSWVIGDSVRYDIEPGVAAGANCIHYTSPHPKRKGAKELVQLPEGSAFRLHELLDARSILAK